MGRLPSGTTCSKINAPLPQATVKGFVSSTVPGVPSPAATRARSTFTFFPWYAK